MTGADERPDRVRAGDGAPPAGKRFPSSSRIRKSGDIRSLFRRGKRRRTAHLDVFLAASPVSRPRIGVVVGKHGHGSVERNELKRRLKEIGRTRVLPRLWEGGCAMDVMLRARPGAYGARFAELEREIKSVMEEACAGR